METPDLVEGSGVAVTLVVNSYQLFRGVSTRVEVPAEE